MKEDSIGVAVFAEQDEGALVRVSYELASKARELADRLKTGAGAYLIGGPGIEASAAELVAYGMDQVYVVEDRRLHHYDTLPYAKVLTQLIRRTSPQAVLYGATPVGRDLAPRIASELRVGLTADCTGLEIGDYQGPGGKEYKDILFQIRPAWGGNTIATIVTPEHRPQMATVRSGVMKLGEKHPHHKGRIIRAEAGLSGDEFVLRVLERVSAVKKVDLTTANIIVAGGSGVGSKESFKLILQLAEALGGVPAASRAAVDAGYIDHDYQVGQTGTTVRPKLYIACGISGAIQHRAGMSEASKIVAINTDPTAPIFSIAHYGIVGDLNQVIPRLIKAYRTKA
ncbi:MAG: electron transfer flavoprotein subunit alpha/FixB family protein [Planctomycetota bacterium]|nr:electron transfer flavoprotein subunit alpha/FixB family protein [Planctomycetota bacterium]